MLFVQMALLDDNMFFVDFVVVKISYVSYLSKIFGEPTIWIFILAIL